MKTEQQRHIEKYLIIFLVAHTIVWTAMCLSLRSPAPFDAVDAANWGRDLEFGYTKGPYLVGWVSRLGLLLNGGNPSEFAYYFLHMGGIAFGAYGIWLLAMRLLQDSRQALLAVMALGLSTIVNVSAIPYNDNYLLLTLWPYTFYFFIKACFDGRGYWIWAGLFAGLALMAKYSTGIFLPFILFYTLRSRNVRQSYRSWEIYAGIALFCIVCVPNLVWLQNHNFVAITWLTRQVADSDISASLLAYLAVFYPFVFLYLIMRRFDTISRRHRLTEEQRAFVLVYLTPVAMLLVVFLFIHGNRLTEWLQPLAVFYSIALLIFFRPELSDKAMNNYYRVFAAFVAFFIAGYAVAYTAFDDKVNDTRYLIPLSREANELWREKTGLPLHYVGGETDYEWLSFYAPDHPRLINRWNPSKHSSYNPAIEDGNIRKYGALLIAPHACGDKVFESTFEEYPFMRSAEIVDHDFQFRGANRRNCLGYYLPQRKAGA